MILIIIAIILCLILLPFFIYVISLALYDLFNGTQYFTNLLIEIFTKEGKNDN